MTPVAPERILLVRLSAVGDVIHALHALASLRVARPRAFVGFLVEDRAATLLDGHPDVDRLHIYRRRRWQEGLLPHPLRTLTETAAFLRDIRRSRYAVVVDLQGNLKGGILSALSGAPRRIGLARGFGREASHLFSTERVGLPSGPVHRVDRALALLGPLGVDRPGGTPRVPVSREDVREVEAFLARGSLVSGRFAVLHPATSGFGLHKRWSPRKFGALARLLRDLRGLSSVVSWGPGEEDLAREVAASSGGAARTGPRTRSLTALAHLAGQAALFVASDTGALHLAALLGTPTVGLFGPKDPRIYGPRGPRTAVVTGGVDCSPCPRRNCPDPVCMKAIEPFEVLETAAALLGEDGDGLRRTEEREVIDA